MIDFIKNLKDSKDATIETSIDLADIQKQAEYIQITQEEEEEMNTLLSIVKEIGDEYERFNKEVDFLVDFYGIKYDRLSKGILEKIGQENPDKSEDELIILYKTEEAIMGEKLDKELKDKLESAKEIFEKKYSF